MGGEEMVRLDKMEDSYKGMRENYWQGGDIGRETAAPPLTH